MKAYIRKTDALDRPYYVEYEQVTVLIIDNSEPVDLPVRFTATGFTSFGAAHAHATALGAEIHTDCDQHDDYLSPNDQAGGRVRDAVLNGGP